MRGFFQNQNLSHHTSHHTKSLILHIKHIMSPTATNGGGLVHLNGKPDSKIEFQESFAQIINGKSAPTKTTRQGINPATLAPLAEVPVATQSDLDSAVIAAKAAFKTWSKTPYEDRRCAVLKFADAIESLKGGFRDLLITEQGKPVRLNLDYCHNTAMSMC